MDENCRLLNSQNNEPKHRRADLEETENYYGHEHESQSKESNGITVLLCVSAFGALCGSGLVYGYNVSVLNNPEILLREFFSSVRNRRTGHAFSERALNWYWSSCVAALPLMAFFGSFIGPKCATKFGRKRTLLCNNILLILAGLLQGLSKPLESYELFLLGRIVVGLQSGVSKTVCPMYLSEVSPKKYRGGVVSLFQWFSIFGVALANACGFRSVFGNSQHWPHLFTMLVVFAMIQLLVLSFCPESPRHLLIVEKKEIAAMNALRKLRGDMFPIKEEIHDMQKEFNDVKDNDEVPYSDYFRKPELRYPLMLGIMAALAFRFSGVNVVTWYSQPIVNAALSNHSSSSSTETAKYIVCGIAVFRLFIVGFSVRLVDKIGRRRFAKFQMLEIKGKESRCELTGIAGLIISNTILAFLLSDVEVGGQACRGIPLTSNGQYVVVVALFMQSMSVSIGVNCVAWLITPEVFRTNTRAKAAAIVTSVNSVTNFLVALGFDLIREVICGWVFLIFAGILLIPFVYFYLELPVLDGKSINENVAFFENRAKLQRYRCMFKSGDKKTGRGSEKRSFLSGVLSESIENWESPPQNVQCRTDP